MPRPLRPHSSLATRVGAAEASSSTSAMRPRPLASTRGIEEKVEYATDYVSTTMKLIGFGAIAYLTIAYILPNVFGAYGKTKTAWKSL
jgi:hypothetical protein